MTRSNRPRGKLWHWLLGSAAAAAIGVTLVAILPAPSGPAEQRTAVAPPPATAAPATTPPTATPTRATVPRAASPAAPTTTRPTAPSTTAPLRWSKTAYAVTYGGRARSYLVARPTTTTAAKLPVLMVLHGRDVSPQYELKRTNFIGVTGPAILVYPAGYGQSWNAGACCPPAQKAGIDDVGFLSTVIDQVVRGQPQADASRVFLAGYSNGGKMALTLACHDATAFTAVAVFGATSVASCPSPGPVSVMEVAAVGDPEVTIGPGGKPQVINGFVTPTVTGQIAMYRAADGCTAQRRAAAQHLVTVTTWSTCAGGRQVAMAVYQGGSHAWPPTVRDTPGAAQIMWDFFTQQV